MLKPLSIRSNVLSSATSAFCRPLHREPDLLPEGQFERVAVGVGDPRNIADRFADVGRGAGRPALATGFRIEPINLLTAFAGNAKVSEWPKWRVWLARPFDEYDDEASMTRSRQL